MPLLYLGAIYDVCFGSGTENHTTWTREATWKLARVMEKVWDKICLAGNLGGGNQTWEGTSVRETQTVLFSRDHLKFVVARRLLENTRQVEGRIILPIIWHTTPSRRNRYAGKACKVRFEITQIPPAPAALNTVTLPMIATLEEVNHSAHLTGDDFWTAVCLACGKARLDYLFLYRAVYVYIIDKCNTEQLKPAAHTIYDTLSDAWQGPSGNLAHFWDTKKKCHDYIKNHMCAKGVPDHSYTDGRFLGPAGLWADTANRAQGANKKQKTGSEERKISAEKALLGFGTTRGLYQLVLDSPRAAVQDRASFFSEGLVHDEQRQSYIMLLQNVDADFRNLPQLIRYCTDNCVIASGFVLKLLEFRHRWNLNRRTWAFANANGNATDEERDANVTLLERAGFPLEGRARMLYAIKTPRERSGRRS